MGIIDIKWGRAMKKHVVVLIIFGLFVGHMAQAMYSGWRKRLNNVATYARAAATRMYPSWLSSSATTRGLPMGTPLNQLTLTPPHRSDTALQALTPWSWRTLWYSMTKQPKANDTLSYSNLEGTGIYEVPMKGKATAIITAAENIFQTLKEPMVKFFPKALSEQNEQIDKHYGYTEGLMIKKAIQRRIDRDSELKAKIIRSVLDNTPPISAFVILQTVKPDKKFNGYGLLSDAAETEIGHALIETLINHK